MAAERAASQRAFFGVAALIFVGSAAVTFIRCGSMAAMGQMAMPGDWNMSMAWMPMPGQTWLSAASSFLGMWAVMMVAMMLPSLMPMLCGYRQALGGSREKRLNELTALVGLGYFFVWTLFGIAAFAVGMEVRVMAVVTAATTVERLAPGGERAARLIGAAFVGAGLFLIERATAL